MKKQYLLIIPVVIAVLFGLQKFHTRSLEQERGRVSVAVEATQHALQIVVTQQKRAAQALHRADSTAAVRAAAAPHRAAVVAAAPKDCAPAIAALEANVASLTSENRDLRNAFAEQQKATAVLTPAATELAHASKSLVKASGGSFWRDITPDLGFGITAGVATSGGFAVVVGPTLHWDF